MVSAGEDFTEEQGASMASLVTDIRGRYGIAANSVIRHFDVTGKHRPAPYVDASKWAALKVRICGGAASSGGLWTPLFPLYQSAQSSRRWSLFIWHETDTGIRSETLLKRTPLNLTQHHLSGGSNRISSSGHFFSPFPSVRFSQGGPSEKRAPHRRLRFLIWKSRRRLFVRLVSR